MKRTFKTLALATFIATALASCQPEEFEVMPYVEEQTLTQTHNYTVDGIPYSSHEELSVLMGQLFALVNEGHTVHIYPTSHSGSIVPSKEVETVTFTTRDEKEALNWATSMYNQGYKVTVTLDQSTGLYTCVATRER